MSHFRSTRNWILVILFSSFVVAGCKTPEPVTEEPMPTEPVGVSPDDEPQGDVVAEEVEFDVAGLTTHGTITRPRGDGPFPAIAIAAGSGPTDRDWRNPLIPGPNGSAALLARDLARQGVVLLRYDKRGTGETGMPDQPVTWDQYVAELSGALKILASKDYVDASRIHVAGHSEGGAHAMKVAQNPPVPLASLILLSTAGRSLRDIVVWQVSNQIQAAQLNPSAKKAEIEAFTRAVDAIAAGEDVVPSAVGQLQGVQQFIAALQNPDSVEFARSLLRFEPTEAFEKIDLPVLVLSGAKDLQVDPDLDAKPLAEAAKGAGLQTTIVIAPDADHVLKQENTPRDELTPAAGVKYNAEGRELAKKVVPTIVSWVSK